MHPDIQQILHDASQYTAVYPQGALGSKPTKELAIVMCMDARLKAYSMLGIKEGEAHVIRNAGGVVTDDVVRSLIISQRLLGTRHIMLVHHTDCGMTTFTDDQMYADLQAETGHTPTFAMEAFDDPDQNVSKSIERIKSNPFIPHRDSVLGFVFEVETGKLRLIDSTVDLNPIENH